MTHDLKWRGALFLKDVAEDLQSLFTSQGYFLRCDQRDQILADNVVRDAPLERLMVVESVLPTFGIDDDIPG